MGTGEIQPSQRGTSSRAPQQSSKLQNALTTARDILRSTDPALLADPDLVSDVMQQVTEGTNPTAAVTNTLNEKKVIFNRVPLPRPSNKVSGTGSSVTVEQQRGSSPNTYNLYGGGKKKKKRKGYFTYE